MVKIISPLTGSLHRHRRGLVKKLGEGFIAVLKANNHLEDAIMLGMDKVYVDEVMAELKGPASFHLGQAINCLEVSRDFVREIQSGFDRVLSAAASEGCTRAEVARRLKIEVRKSRNGTYAGRCIAQVDAHSLRVRSNREGLRP